MSWHTRITQGNAENVAGMRAKNTVTTGNLGLKRSALGEIGNRVVRSNSVATKPGSTVSLKEAVKPVQRSASVKSIVSVNAQKPGTFVKPLPPKVNHVTSRVKRTFSNTSVTSVVLSTQHSEHDEDETVLNEDSGEFSDVDKADERNPLLVANYAFEIYEYLRTLEDKFPIQEDYLSGQQVTSRMRMVLVDWLVDVQLQYHLLQETLYLGIQIMDRYLQADRSVSKKYLQLVGVAALYVACKYEEVYMPDITDFVFITDSAYSKQQVLAMEVKIVKALEFNFSRPISLTFLRRYSKVVDANPIHHCFSKYFLELALMEYSLVHVKPSLIAAAALYISLCICDLKGKKGPQHWDAKMVHYSSYTRKEVQNAAYKLAAVVEESADWKFNAVRKKYSNPKMMKVSLRSELDGAIFKSLAKGRNP